MSITSLTARILAACALAAGPLVAVGSPAVAAGGVTQIDGLLVYETPGPGAVCTVGVFDAAYNVTGSIEGCWYIRSTNYEHVNHAGGFVATGTEEFRGCWTGTDNCGAFQTTYTFTAKYDGLVELHGRCHHPIVDGDGAFADAGGVINMHDNPDGSAVFSGHLDLVSGSGKARSASAARAGTSTQAADELVC